MQGQFINMINEASENQLSTEQNYDENKIQIDLVASSRSKKLKLHKALDNTRSFESDEYKKTSLKLNENSELELGYNTMINQYQIV